MSNFGTTDFDYRVALGQVADWQTWSVFGENLNVPIGTEVLASFGGMWTPMLAAETMTVVSTDVNDIAGGTGAQAVLIEGMGAGYVHLNEVVPLNGTTPVITTGVFLGINRMTVYGSGTSQTNVGTVTAASTASVTTEAQIEIGQGVSHHTMYHTSANGTLLVRSLYINALNVSGAAPKLTIKAYVYNSALNTRVEVLRHSIDTVTSTFDSYSQIIPFPIPGASSVWLEVTSDKAGAQVTARISVVEYDI